MVDRHPVPDGDRQEVRRQTPGIHPAVRYPRRVDAGRRDQPSQARRGDRDHGARAVLYRRREGHADVGRHCGQRARRAGLRIGPRAGCERQADRRRRARCLADGWRRFLRRPAAGRQRAVRARQVRHRRRWPLRFPHREAGELSGAHRRTGRQDAARHGPASVPAGARARDRNGAWLRPRCHALVR